MNVLVIGSGGREHALTWKIAQSPLLNKLFIAPGNAGTASLGTNLPIDVNNFEGIKNAVIDNNIQLVVVGPEDPLVNGIHDYFLDDQTLRNIPVIGPQKHAATLEGSKEFAKQFMTRHNIPTAKYFTATPDTIDAGYAFLETQTAPYVLKADGLAAGKGVLILHSLDDAKAELKKMLEGKFGEASSKVVIEECLKGIELSIFILTDGKGYVILPEAKDYKRIGEGDTGLNTGGMGAVTPVPFAGEEFIRKIEDQVIKPTVEGLHKDGIPYKGFIFFGLMNDKGDPKVIEYNVRMGDPESEVVIPRIKSDLLELLIAAGEEKLDGKKIELDTDTYVTVMLVSGGYPEAYDKNMIISGLENFANSTIFHAGTKLSGDSILTNGGRVLSVTSNSHSMQEALRKSYDTIAKIDFNKKYFRTDIGFDL